MSRPARMGTGIGIGIGSGIGIGIGHLLGLAQAVDTNGRFRVR